MIMPARARATIDQKPSKQDQIQLLQQQQEQQQPLRCPRCDSANTKFCYYNNYSLSQPRHFCKACKRYWTRGGTLRNVPVGGGCRRKNKRVNKRPFSASSPPSTTPNSSFLPSSSGGIHDVRLGTLGNPSFCSGGSSHLINSPLLYGPTSYLSPGVDITNFPFASNYDGAHAHMNSSSIMSGGIELGFLSGSDNGSHQKVYGFSTNPKQIIQDVISSNPNSSIISTFGSNSSCPPPTTSLNPTTTTSNMPLLQQEQRKFDFPNMFPYEHLHLLQQMKGINSQSLGGVQYLKEDGHVNEDQGHHAAKVKMEYMSSSYRDHHHEYNNLMDANHHHEPGVVTSTHTSMSWNNDPSGRGGTTGGGQLGGANNWHDPSYSAIGSSSSIPSLI